MNSKPPPNPWDVATIEAKAPDGKSVADARKVLAHGHIGKVELRADGQGWWATCKGMTGTYEVSVKRGPRGGLQSQCSCYSSKRPCKHALALLLYLAEHPEARPEAPPETVAARDLESLLRAAFAAPEEDTPRLVLADYFEENGETDRAELIRVQCELARTPTDDAGWRDLVAREARTLAAAGKAVGKLPNGFMGKFVRGFLRVDVGFTGKFVGGEGLPARLVGVFRDGWVEFLRQFGFRKGMVPFYRLVGTLELSNGHVSPDEVEVFVREFRPGDPETRTRIVRLPVACETRYRELTAGLPEGSA